MKLSDYKQQAARKILIYGAPKTGKTELVGALSSQGFKLWWFDLEDGIKTLLRKDSKANTDNIELYRLPDSKDYPIAVDTIYKVLSLQTCTVCNVCGRVNCVKHKGEGTPIDLTKFTNKDVLVIDSVSQLSLSVMNHIMRKEIEKDAENAKPGWDEYYKQGTLLERIFSIVKHANYNVIAISHEQVVELDDKKKRLVPVAGTSNYSKTFSKDWDDIIYTDVVNGKFRVFSSVTESNNAIIGSRTGKSIGDKGLIELFKD